MSRPRIAVIVPAYNEEDRIVPTLTRTVEYFSSQEYEWTVAVLDDGCTDKTAELVDSIAAEEPRVSRTSYGENRGKGFAVRYGMLHLDADYLLFSDADLATPIEEVEKLFAAMPGHDIAIGSRPLKESRLDVRQPFHRELLGRCFNLAVQLLAVRGIHDTQCGFKLFTSKAAKDVFVRCRFDGFSFDFESLLIAKDLGLKIAEVPVVWRHQEGSKVVLSRDGPRMLADLVRLRLRGRRGRLEPRAD